ncbi:hypothetical protein CEUSTIGMA_g3171.t1 [Chlamydomonas eustigma]|uniref:UBX domain-containing protein n=1 Tax=Chlamydomonas eustigma TaxID=1157962 RepID=A0A250WY00_9CHLO|nr:hypothetical protein CEUSTIGMA_g3171.t1 [Chlamydomonas eustigma]|eukprot:GAX75728.1 hypothetical protein CEUSTIGMA_g3171.t1 [Chlamydomonas eustigma]
MVLHTIVCLLRNFSALHDPCSTFKTFIGMEEEVVDQSEAIASFCSIVGCSSHVASHYLDACGFNLSRAVDFYFQNPPDVSEQASSALEESEVDPPNVQVVNVDPQHEAEHFAQFGEDNEELQRALAASMNAVRGFGAAGGREARETVVVEDENDDVMPSADEDLAILARLREQAMSASREASGIMEEMSNVTQGMLNRPGSVSMFPGLAFNPDMFLPQASNAGHRVRTNTAFGGGGGGGVNSRQHIGYPSNASENDEAMDDLPEGIDAREAEEARMLEAALLGVPYEGRMPDYSARGPTQSARPVDTAMREQRSLRWEQDQAYEDSLAADKAKAESEARARLEAERAQRQAEEAAAAEARRLEMEEKALKDILERKQRSLPAEPSSSDSSSVNIMIRLPDGSRLSRRFCKTDPLQAAFDFVDVQSQAVTFRPGSYNLINSYPRKVFSDGTRSTLEDSGITSDTALFLESTHK